MSLSHGHYKLFQFVLGKNETVVVYVECRIRAETAKIFIGNERKIRVCCSNVRNVPVIIFDCTFYTLYRQMCDLHCFWRHQL